MLEKHDFDNDSKIKSIIYGYVVSYQSFQSFNRVTPLLTKDPASARAGPLSASGQTLSAAAEPSLVLALTSGDSL